ncbi:MAG: polyribonucleotide nucleotidyltransferase [Verrucomicrobia bacterium]|nr:polyribonucleotide nucleotidyltransferase [Verrucomicrobiota bacterium]
MKKFETRVKIGDKELIFQTGSIARQADGAVWVQQGDTVVFSTACASKAPQEGVDFLPLKVDYTERFSAAGKTLGGYVKREGRPTERETLICRLIDRPLRPMFEKGYYHEIQSLNYVWSYDGIHNPDVLAICGASAAFTLSSIPLIKPIGAVRVGRIDGQFVMNPSNEEIEKSDLDLVLAGTGDAVLMIEGYCDFLTEDEVIAAIEAGQKVIHNICGALTDLREQWGKPKNLQTLRLTPEETLKAVTQSAEEKLKKTLLIKGKAEREEATEAIKQEVKALLFPEGETSAHSPLDFDLAFKKTHAEAMRKSVLDTGIRADGRTTEQVRPIEIEQHILPRAHGSSLFTRGETQSVAVCTLGGETMAQRYESLHAQGQQHFYLQYFFPPFSVGEVGRVGAPGRREVGHGKLAERALQVAIPSRETFPYTIRVESNITESNGSSSMASVCGGCLAMMDAGVPIKRPVAGIAMGLILEGKRYAILSDILGLEDALGDMDFKITGDEKGITAFQMDIKVEGITHDIMLAALLQAKKGRISILKEMLKAQPEPRSEMSEHAPRIETLKVPTSKIGAIIGPGGKQIRAIVEETGVEINIDDDGTVSLASPSMKGLIRAKEIIEGLTAEIEVGRVYQGKVVAIVPFGLFIEILPGKEGLCHISELEAGRLSTIEEFGAKPGDPIRVKVMEIDERGKVKLSRKVLLDSKS